MSAPSASAGELTLVRALGVRALAATTFNVMIGSGIFVLPAIAAGMMGAAAPAGLSDAARRIAGPVGGTLLAVGAVVSMVGHVSGMTLATPRALYALGRDGFIPGASRALTSVHEFVVVGAVLCVATLLYVATAPARLRPLASTSES